MTNRGSAGYIGPELVVRGRLTGTGDMLVEGRFEGDVEVDGLFGLGSEGRVVGPVKARSVSVAGHLRGDVSALESVTIEDGGCIDGDVRAQRIAIDDGGRLHGGIDMDFDFPSDTNAEEP